jgi:hypothetical protein
VAFVKHKQAETTNVQELVRDESLLENSCCPKKDVISPHGSRPIRCQPICLVLSCQLLNQWNRIFR